MEHERKIIIWGFPGIGKSSAADGQNIIDADSHYFRFHMFDVIFPPEIQLEYRNILSEPYPENLIHFVKEVDADVVLINCHTSLLHHFENIYLIYPSGELKDNFLSRYKNRGNDDSYIAYMNDTYEEILAALSTLPYPRYIIKDKNTYLKDIIFHDQGELNMSRFIGKKDLADLIEKSHSYDNSPDIEQVKTFSDNTSKNNRSIIHGKAHKSTRYR